MTDTPTVRLRRVAPGVLLKLETRGPNATHADRVAEVIARGVELPAGSAVREAVDGPLCVALAMQCAVRGWKLQAFVQASAPIEVVMALRAYGVQVTRVAGSQVDVRAAARADGPLLSDLVPDAALTAAQAVGRELVPEAPSAVVATGALLEGLASTLGARAVVARPLPFAEAWAWRARLGREEGLLVSTQTAGWVATAAAVQLELGPGARVATVAVDTGERDFSLQPDGPTSVAKVLGPQP